LQATANEGRYTLGVTAAPSTTARSVRDQIELRWDLVGRSRGRVGTRTRPCSADSDCSAPDRSGTALSGGGVRVVRDREGELNPTGAPIGIQFRRRARWPRLAKARQASSDLAPCGRVREGNALVAIPLPQTTPSGRARGYLSGPLPQSICRPPISRENCSLAAPYSRDHNEPRPSQRPRLLKILPKSALRTNGALL
jgi:hypothetical protein